MTLWSDLDRKLDHFAGDIESADSSLLFSRPLRIEAWNWAQRMFCAHTPRQRYVTATIDAGQRSIILPDDFYAVEGIYDSYNEHWWWPMRRRPGDARALDDQVQEFWLWGDKLFLEDDISYTSQDLVLYYWAYWPEVEYTEGSNETVTVTQPTVYTPRWAELALMHLTVSNCMVSEEVFSSDINQYKIRVEAGTPLDNPRMQSARWHLDMYERLLDKIPPTREMVVR